MILTKKHPHIQVSMKTIINFSYICTNSNTDQDMFATNKLLLWLFLSVEFLAMVAKAFKIDMMKTLLEVNPFVCVSFCVSTSCHTSNICCVFTTHFFYVIPCMMVLGIHDFSFILLLVILLLHLILNKNFTHFI